MRTPLLVLGLSLLLTACGGGGDNNNKTMTTDKPQCSDGIDNDGDGLIDFPDDPGCVGENDESEDSLPSPQCSDGRDNDGDGKTDFPEDPGCSSMHQDSETDDCPDGPNCPQCSNNKDDDGNGQTDYPSDPGCTSASDQDEFTDDPLACGMNVLLLQLPFDGHKLGNLGAGGPSNLTSVTCGGEGKEDVYELRLSGPKVIKATTNLPGTDPHVDTVLSVRDIGCQTEMVCNDDATGTSVVAGSSAVVVSAPVAGVYYLVVDNRSQVGGAYELQVNLLAGEGEACDPAAPTATCGDGLVCRIPLGGTANVCSKPMCSDGVDDDGDGKNDYPEEPGCDSPDDNDEMDTCPGAGCPACADGIDNDGDTHIDYPNDPNCTSASGHSESCVDTDPVPSITAPTTSGTTVGLHNDTHQTCGSSSTTTAPEATLRFTPPMQLDSLTITTTPQSSFDAVTAVYDATCGGTALNCQDTSPITLTNVTSDIYIVVDGYSSGTGTFTVGLTGKIRNGQSCEGPFVTGGAFTCGATASCTGPVGSKVCQPFACIDGLDNDGDGKTDYPFDPGCASPSDNDEANPATAPVCSNGTDDDADGMTDFPADIGCGAASDTSEAFCPTETDPIAGAINAKTITGTTTGKTNNYTPTCQTTSNNDVVYSLNLPVPVVSLQIDTNGTTYDTILVLANTHCSAEVACDDDGGDGTQSLISLSNVAAGNYAVIFDGYSTNSGPFVLNTSATVAPGAACTAAGFMGATAWLHCPVGTTCTGGTCH